MNETLRLGGDLFGELNRLQECFAQALRLEGAGSIRALPR